MPGLSRKPERKTKTPHFQSRIVGRHTTYSVRAYVLREITILKGPKQQEKPMFTGVKCVFRE